MTRRSSKRRTRPRDHGVAASDPPSARAVLPVAIAAVVAAILFAAAVRVRLCDVPLERDEGEYAYAGQLLLEGVPPYELAYNMKFPGTYYAYAVILAAFGQSARGIHLGLLLVNLATTVLVFLLGRRLFGDLAGAVAGSAFAILALDRGILGLFAHATHFVILPVVAGMLLLLRAIESRRASTFVASGVMFGVATLMKQHAVFFVPLGALLAADAALRRDSAGARAAVTRAGWLLAGAAAPLALLVLVFSAQGVLGRFWFWTFQYASEYATRVPVSQAPAAFARGLEQVTSMNRPIWIAALAGAGALAVRRGLGGGRVVVAGLSVASLLALCPGFYFRPHYFIVLLPVTALLVGVAADSCARALSAAMPRRAAVLLASTLCVAIAGVYVARERDYLFSWSARELSRQSYGANPFIESVEIARYIRERTGPGDRIAVLGSEPQIYFYSERRSATGHIYMYPLMEPQQFASTMQDEMIRQIEAAHPTYLVLARIATSWLVGPRSEQRLVRWANRYASQCYDLVGIADIYSAEATAYVWDAEATAYRPRSENLISTYRRKSEAACAISQADLSATPRASALAAWTTGSGGIRLAGTAGWPRPTLRAMLDGAPLRRGRSERRGRT